MAWWWAGGAAIAAGYLRLADPTRPGGPFLPCPLRHLTGWDCPGCGTTRAGWAIVNARPLEALGYNALAVVAVPLLLWAWVLLATGRWPDRRHPFRQRWFAPVALTVALVFGVARNLPVAPFDALGT
jgi:hypothetical protein